MSAQEDCIADSAIRRRVKAWWHDQRPFYYNLFFRGSHTELTRDKEWPHLHGALSRNNQELLLFEPGDYCYGNKSPLSNLIISYYLLLLLLLFGGVSKLN